METSRHIKLGFLRLTPKERIVMGHIAWGKPNKAIAAELGLSQRTIEAHRAKVFQKMQVKNAVELAHWALAQGLLACKASGDQ